MSKETLYPVHEVFHTFQGEGIHMGVPAFFIRLYGCPVHCPFCDSAGTWHKDWVPKDIKRHTANELRDMVLAARVDTVVITGGEPGVFDLVQLVHACRLGGNRVHVETSGAYLFNVKVSWLTVSPKKWKPPIERNVRDASEFKFIIQEPADIALYSKMIEDLGYEKFSYNPDDARIIPIWLHPEWGQRNNPEVLTAIAEAVKGEAFPYRAGYQIHKLYQVDALDKRSRPLVPLGGDPKKGF